MQYLLAGRVSAHYFDVLALQPIIGRNFSADEDRPHGSKVVVLSYGLWRTLFDGNPGILGQSVLLKGDPYTIIGVLPERATTPLNAQIYTALQPSREGEGRAANFNAIVRLREGANWQQADIEVEHALANSARALHFSQREIDPSARRTYHCVALQQAQTATLRSQVLALMLASGFICPQCGHSACAAECALRSERVRCADHARRRPDVVGRNARGRHHANAAGGTDRPGHDTARTIGGVTRSRQIPGVGSSYRLCSRTCLIVATSGSVAGALFK
jgi:hypothetical protein